MATPKHAASVTAIRTRPIFVDIPGTDLSLKCCRPQPIDLIASGAIVLPVFITILEHANTGQPMSELPKDEAQRYAEFIDRWTCAAVLEPTIVMTRDEAAADPETRLWVEELPPSARVAVWTATNDRLLSRELTAAVTDFRRHEPARPAAGSDGETVRVAPLVPAGPA